MVVSNRNLRDSSGLFSVPLAVSFSEGIYHPLKMNEWNRPPKSWDHFKRKRSSSFNQPSIFSGYLLVSFRGSNYSNLGVQPAGFNNLFVYRLPGW